MIFLLGATACFVYFVVAGLLSMWLAVTERDEDMSGGEFFVCTALWPLGLPYLAVRKVWR